MDSPNARPKLPARYLLRGLLRCRPCNELLIPALSSSGRRFYGCPRRQCPRPWVPAEPTEQLVWDHFAALNEAAARDTLAEQRQQVLVAVLAQVTLGLHLGDLEYDWRD